MHMHNITFCKKNTKHYTSRSLFNITHNRRYTSIKELAINVLCWHVIIRLVYINQISWFSHLFSTLERLFSFFLTHHRRVYIPISMYYYEILLNATDLHFLNMKSRVPCLYENIRIAARYLAKFTKRCRSLWNIDTF